MNNVKAQNSDSHIEETLKVLRDRVTHVQELTSILRSRLSEVTSDEVPQNPPLPVPGIECICPLSRSIGEEIDHLGSVIDTLEYILQRLCV